MYSIGTVSYPLPFRAAHMGLRLFTVTSPQLTQRVSNRLPAGTHEKHSCLSFRPAEFADKESFCALTHTDCSQLKQDFLAKESSQCTVLFFLTIIHPKTVWKQIKLSLWDWNERISLWNDIITRHFFKCSPLALNTNSVGIIKCFLINQPLWIPKCFHIPVKLWAKPWVIPHCHIFQ